MPQYMRPFPQIMPNTCVVSIQNVHYTQHFPLMCLTHQFTSPMPLQMFKMCPLPSNMWELLSPIIISTPIYIIQNMSVPA
jgi:hypothetical protein